MSENQEEPKKPADTSAGFLSKINGLVYRIESMVVVIALIFMLSLIHI